MRMSPADHNAKGPLMETVGDQHGQKAVDSPAIATTNPDVTCSTNPATAVNTRLRLLIETDAGGDLDDEQSLVRFLLYANEWDVEGIIANRPVTRRPEN